MIHKQLHLKKMENQTIKQATKSNESLSPQAETTKKQWIKPEMSQLFVNNTAGVFSDGNVSGGTNVS
jgi:hypothetical protein